MKFFDLFKTRDYGSGINNFGTLYDKLSTSLGKNNQNEILKCACIAGLMARVAYIDFKVNPKEKLFILSALKNWTNFTETEINLISEIAIEQIKELAGLENHKYCQFLNQILDSDEKYELLESLFALAASDEIVHGNEIEEIRVIYKGLRLEHKHFVSAQATVFKNMGSLKN